MGVLPTITRNKEQGMQITIGKKNIGLLIFFCIASIIISIIIDSESWIISILLNMQATFFVLLLVGIVIAIYSEGYKPFIIVVGELFVALIGVFLMSFFYALFSFGYDSEYYMSKASIQEILLNLLITSTGFGTIGGFILLANTEKIHKGYFARLCEWNYSNGNLKKKGKRRKLKKSGLWKYYDKYGRLEKKVYYERGKPNGLFECYHENCRLQLKGNYKNNKKEGLWEVYDEAENLIKKEIYEDGKLIN